MAERKIGGATYRVDQLPAKRSLILFARIGKLLGPGLPSLVAAIANRTDDEAASNEAAAKALSSILSDVEPEAFADFLEEIVELAEINENGKSVPVSFDGHFSGRMGDAVKVAAFVLKEQFGDFFPELLAAGKAAKTAH
jgi:hypothetical protein